MHNDDQASLLNAKMSVTVSCFWAAQVILLIQLKTVYPLSCSQCSSVSSPTCLNSPGPPEKDDSDANHDDEAGKMMKMERGCDGDASETVVCAEQEVCPLENENSTLIVVIGGAGKRHPKFSLKSLQSAKSSQNFECCTMF